VEPRSAWISRLRHGPRYVRQDIQVPLAPSVSRRVIPFAATVLRSGTTRRYRSACLRSMTLRRPSRGRLSRTPRLGLRPSMARRLSGEDSAVVLKGDGRRTTGKVDYGRSSSRRACATSSCGPCASENHESAAIDPGSLSSESLPSSPQQSVQGDVKHDRSRARVRCTAAKH